MTMRAVLVETIEANGATVEVYEMCVGLNVADLRGFEIRTSTGYRAVFSGAHTECDRILCVKIGCRVTHKGLSPCHGPHHLEQVMEYARKVADTYRPAPATRKPARPAADWTPASFQRLRDKIVDPGWVTAELF